MMIVVDIMACRSLKQRRKFTNCFIRFGPLILCLLATVFIMAEPSRHVLSDTGVWPLCWAPQNGTGIIPRINQTWNTECVASSLEYHCDIPCCVPEEDYLAAYPNNDPPEGTRNVTESGKNALNLTDAAWRDHFYYDHCLTPDGDVKDYTNTTTGKDNCDKDHPDQPDPVTGWTYTSILECKCDACVFVESMNHLSPVGIIFTATLTYSGFILLAVGALWNANIVKKIKKLKDKCRELKEHNEKRKVADQEQEGTKAKAVSGASLGSSGNDAAKSEDLGEIGLDFGEPPAEDCED